MTNSVSTYVAVPRPVPQADGPAPDRDENVLDGIVLVTDRGIEHTRNEDAGAAGTVADDDGPWAIAAVVCDGVSTSADAQNASRAASVAGVDAMLTALAAHRDVTSVMVAGLTDAAKAAADSTSPEGFSPASCTYTAAVVVPAGGGGVQIAVANVGDSRVYWLPESPAQPQRLTVDDTVAQQLISAGIPPDSPAVLRGEHTLTRWFGRDADHESWDGSNVYTMSTAERGFLVLCSDGLHNYLPEAADIAKFCIGTSPTEAARALVDHALRAGGHDNITVIIVPVGAS
jgi:serine/threonine protein phosphatase PrpC